MPASQTVSRTPLEPGTETSKRPRPLAWRYLAVTLRVLQVRLRFLLVLVLAFVVVGKWDLLRNYWDTLTRSGPGAAAPTAISTDTEYFCPMCPGVLSDWPSKCPVCNMALVRRKKGEAVPLPEGVVARMQFSPYRMQLAGIQTSPVTYQPLAQEVVTVGYVDYLERCLYRITAPAAGFIQQIFPESTWTAIKQGNPVGRIYVPLSEVFEAVPGGIATPPPRERLAVLQQRLKMRDIAAEDIKVAESGDGYEILLRSPAGGHILALNGHKGQHVPAGATLGEVVDLSRVSVKAEISEKDSLSLKEGQKVEASSEAFPGQRFVGQVRMLASQIGTERSFLQARFEMDNPRQELRPGMLVTVRAKVPVSQLEFLTRLAAEERRNLAILDILAHSLFTPELSSAESGVEALTKTAVLQVLHREGFALAVPDSAVVDTGTRKVVYIESGPGMFDGVEVVLGPRCGEFYPVLRGLAAGQKVATAGSFLIDAETRLNPSIAASYFGAARGSNPVSDRGPAGSSPRRSAETPDSRVLLQLSAADQALVAKQRLCPITGQPLGSMGVPTRVLIGGRIVFLCCEGCEPELKRNPNKYLAKLPSK
jgi:Cu(I)/Ag(I) efflux system membrane fusion protein